MSWSAWIQDPPRMAGFVSASHRLVTSANGDGFEEVVDAPIEAQVRVFDAARAAALADRASNPNIQVTAISTTASGAASRNENAPAVASGSVSCHIDIDAAVLQVEVLPGYQDYRDDFPPLLWDLVEDQDFALIPGTGDYVEYQPGVAVLSGWTRQPIPADPSTSGFYDLAPNIRTTQASATAENSARAAFHEAGFDFEPHATSLSGMYSGGTPPAYSDGALVAEVPIALGSSVDHVVSFNAGASLRWAVSAFVRDIPGSATAGGWSDANWIFDTQPRPALTLPPWRYWIPGTINQHMQRRDGRGRGGVPMARGSATRQTPSGARDTY